MTSVRRMPELFIVFNPGSGCQDKDQARHDIEEVLRAAGCRFEFIEVRNGDVPGTCREAARKAAAGGGAIVAVGGDGTLNAAAQAAHAEDCLLGLIPQGTFNLFARDHAIPLEAAAAAQALTQAQPQELQLGWVNQQAFVVNASLGLYPQLLADREHAKQRLGRKRWVAVLAGLKTFFGWSNKLTLDAEIDGEPVRMVIASLFVCNNRLQLDNLLLDDDVVASVTQGWLGAISAPPLSFGRKLRVLVEAVRGRLDYAPAVSTFAFRNLTIAARHARRLRVSVDGEVRWMELPLRISIAPRPLKVLLPGEAHAGGES